MRLIDRVLDLIYPPRCAFCGRLLAGGWRGNCKRCREHLPRVPDSVQGQSFKHIEKCLSPLYYTGGVKESLHRFKFSSVTAYGQVYAGLMAQCVRDQGLEWDVMTWVPISRKRRRKRGFDQGELLARCMAKDLGGNCMPLLKKIRDNPPQSRTGGREQRRANAKGVYACRDEGLVRGRRILLVDDIVTTGATLSEAAGVLKAAGADSVCCITLARAQD